MPPKGPQFRAPPGVTGASVSLQVSGLGCRAAQAARSLGLSPGQMQDKLAPQAPLTLSPVLPLSTYTPTCVAQEAQPGLTGSDFHLVSRVATLTALEIHATSRSPCFS